jgi:predicted transcriptional regulator
MSIFRVEKNANYTVISNYHLRDKNLSLKTIGLLSIILSLPETWDYSQAGLAAICKDGEDSIRSGLKELEKYGYLERERERDDSGRMKGSIYHIYEIPKNKRETIGNTVFEKDCKAGRDVAKHKSSKTPRTDLPEWEYPILDKPRLD